MKLNILVAGPQRTGSSWLDRALRQHPDVSLPELTKETFFFDKYYSEDISSYFSRYFSNAKPDNCLVEVAPTYFHSSLARERLVSRFPNLKVFIILRDPVSRAFSLFRHEVAKGRSPDDLQLAIKKNPEIIESGRYAYHCKQWVALFGEENVFFVDNDSISMAPDKTFNEVLSRSNLKSFSLPDAFKERFGEGKVPRYPLLAKFASRSASSLRKYGFDRVVEFGKSIGLKKVYDGGDSGKLKMTPEQARLLSDYHAEDIRFVQSLLSKGGRQIIKM